MNEKRKTFFLLSFCDRKERNADFDGILKQALRESKF
jgi:hypothetical protein